MINKMFGVYLVLDKNEELTKEKKHVYWQCECQKCKSIQNVRADNLKRLPKNCPNCKNDLTNQQFGKLTVLYKTRLDSNGHSYWMCQCECGNQKEISSSNLKNSGTKSCGCIHSEITSKIHFQDLTNQKFGKLTVIKRITEIGDGQIKWLCQCECGSIVEVQGSNLKNSHTISCGCVKSKGELKIRQILLDLNIDYKTEYVFEDLKNRRFDFYIPSLNICIEFDGKQHFQYVKLWHDTKENFEIAKQRDIEKTEYCKNKNIKLIRIPYYDEEKLDQEYLKNKIYGLEEVETN